MKEAVFVLVGVVTLLAVGLVTVLGLLQQLLRQQGRILRRIESLEAAGTPADAGQHDQGLPIGTPVPDFLLPDAVGRLIGPKDFKGKQMLLVHWNPQCGFCGLIAPDLAALESDLRRQKTELVLVAHGDVESNRHLAEEHGLSSTILHLDGSDPLELFATLGTPVAYLFDGDGRIAEPLAVGANEVPKLAQRAADPQKLATQRSVEESRLERAGLRAGTLAPAFSLPSLNGEQVSLEDYRGQRLLVVFSDPSCGPCNTLAPDLARFHQEEAGDDLAIIMVSRGDVDTNKAKASEHDFEFPVVVQPGWRISKQYGIFATPVAFLVDEDGLIARDVAQGPEEILALGRVAIARQEVMAGAE